MATSCLLIVNNSFLLLQWQLKVFIATQNVNIKKLHSHLNLTIFLFVFLEHIPVKEAAKAYSKQKINPMHVLC